MTLSETRCGMSVPQGVQIEGVDASGVASGTALVALQPGSSPQLVDLTTHPNAGGASAWRGLASATFTPVALAGSGGDARAEPLPASGFSAAATQFAIDNVAVQAHSAPPSAEPPAASPGPPPPRHLNRGFGNDSGSSEDASPPAEAAGPSTDFGAPPPGA